jgi:hypothetical protein
MVQSQEWSRPRIQNSKISAARYSNNCPIELSPWNMLIISTSSINFQQQKAAPLSQETIVRIFGSANRSLILTKARAVYNLNRGVNILTVADYVSRTSIFEGQRFLCCPRSLKVATHAHSSLVGQRFWRHRGDLMSKKRELRETTQQKLM